MNRKWRGRTAGIAVMARRKSGLSDLSSGGRKMDKEGGPAAVIEAGKEGAKE
ncbi:hypothetical protein JCGZ_11212 [Jatropha curcas]|uniref:Uncharacterized protein n=1 Tax=Jatropha curcas TaxID=180498 RepID=A0A067KFN9_JATCU|nr:hypothetical protein JCGZ_11212 [Jatropha curcas]